MKCDFCEKDFPHNELWLKNKHYFCEECFGLEGTEWYFCKNCNDVMPNSDGEVRIGLCDPCNDAFNEYMREEVCSDCEDNDEECTDEECWLSSLEEWL